MRFTFEKFWNDLEDWKIYNFVRIGNAFTVTQRLK